jgi:hypothetical protein
MAPRSALVEGLITRPIETAIRQKSAWPAIYRKLTELSGRQKWFFQAAGRLVPENTLPSRNVN